MQNDNWTEIIVEVPSEVIDSASDIAQMVVPYGIYIEDYRFLEAETLEIAHIDLIDEDLLAKDRSKAYVHIYISPTESPMEAISFLKERYDSEGIKHEISSVGCKEEDWINNWKKYFKPIKVGEKILIRPIWEEECESDGRIILDLEPGLAFGTGTHETTRLCMEMLETYLTEGDKVLDVGCGSGILSVTALLLGASEAIGVDIDKVAIRTADENAVINKVEDKFKGICGDLTDKVSGKYKVVIANIVADIVIKLSEHVENFMYDDSVYIISGIIDSREDDVMLAINDKFEILERKEEKGWVAMVLKLKK